MTLWQWLCVYLANWSGYTASDVVGQKLSCIYVKLRNSSL